MIEEPTFRVHYDTPNARPHRDFTQVKEAVKFAIKNADRHPTISQITVTPVTSYKDGEITWHA